MNNPYFFYYADNIEVLKDPFDLHMINFNRILEHGLPTSIQPLGTEDFELDLTNSNQWDTVRRHISVCILCLVFQR